MFNYCFGFVWGLVGLVGLVNCGGFLFCLPVYWVLLVSCGFVGYLW